MYARADGFKEIRSYHIRTVYSGLVHPPGDYPYGDGTTVPGQRREPDVGAREVRCPCAERSPSAWLPKAKARSRSQLKNVHTEVISRAPEVDTPSRRVKPDDRVAGSALGSAPPFASSSADR